MSGRQEMDRSATGREVAVPDRGSAHAQRGSRVFWSALLLITVLDVITKYIAHTQLPLYRPYEVLGDVFRITLGYNPGAAFGLSLGLHSRWLFTALALVVLMFLWRMYRATPPGDWVQALALGLVSGGAIGNVVNRIWSERGVVDFLDVGIGDARWPTFNVADVGITIGAFLLAWRLWREDAGTPDAASASNAGVQQRTGEL